MLNFTACKRQTKTKYILSDRHVTLFHLIHYFRSLLYPVYQQNMLFYKQLLLFIVEHQYSNVEKQVYFHLTTTLQYIGLGETVQGH